MPADESPQLHQAFENQEQFAFFGLNCRTTVSYTLAADAALSAWNRSENGRRDCRTSPSHKPSRDRPRRRPKQRPTGLWLRGTVWQYRARVPAAVARIIGKTVVSQSLRTSSYSEAIRRARTIAGEWRWGQYRVFP
ncbi:DUF6538 domain-containing protein [Microvirga thermotolerans]|uniref:DUF6538 domain-containing protein n=1 Tax=Microvirga thermotolerans TaxID=2651334 RepID=UPI003CCD40F8